MHKQLTPLLKSSAPTTNFGQISGTFVIKNGILTNNDLFLTAQKYQVTGQGSLNLVKQTVNYQVRASKVTTENGTKQVSEIFVPISVSGTFNNLHFFPDFGYVIKNFLVETTKKIGSNIMERIKSPGQNIGSRLKNLLGIEDDKPQN